MTSDTPLCLPCVGECTNGLGVYRVMTDTMPALLTLSDDVTVYLIATYECWVLRMLCRKLFRCGQRAMGFISPKHWMASPSCMPIRVFVFLKTDGDMAWFLSHYPSLFATTQHLHIEAAFFTHTEFPEPWFIPEVDGVQPPGLQSLHVDLGWVRFHAWHLFFVLCNRMVQRASLETLIVNAQGCMLAEWTPVATLVSNAVCHTNHLESLHLDLSYIEWYGTETTVFRDIMQCPSLRSITLLGASGRNCNRMGIGNELAALLYESAASTVAPLQTVHLDLSGTDLTNVGLRALTRWVCRLPKTLSVLDVKINRNTVCTGPLGGFLQAVSACPRLRHLALGLEHCSLRSAANRAIRILGNRTGSLLEVLDLQMSQNASDFVITCTARIRSGNPNLQRLTLGLNRRIRGPTAFLPSADHLQCLIGDRDCAAVGHMPDISTVHLSFRNIGCGPMVGATLGNNFALVDTLHLDLGCNFLGAHGVRLLVDGLQHHSHRLRALKLGLISNGIGNSGMRSMLGVLVHMATLQTCELDLSYNPLTNEAVDHALGTIVLGRTCITTLTLDVREIAVDGAPMQWSSVSAALLREPKDTPNRETVVRLSTGGRPLSVRRDRFRIDYL